MSFVSNAANLAVQKRARHFFREMTGKYANLALNFQDMIIVRGN